MTGAKQTTRITVGQVAAAVTKAVLCGILGAFILGFLGGVATCYVYFIGGWFGIPVGFIVGATVSRLFSLADVLFTFGLGIGAWWLAEQMSGPHSEPSIIQLVYLMCPFAIGIAVMLACYAIRNRVPDTLKLSVGGTLSAAIAIGLLERLFVSA